MHYINKKAENLGFFVLMPYLFDQMLLYDLIVNEAAPVSPVYFSFLQLSWVIR